MAAASAPGRIRTCDFRLRRAALYPLSYGRGGLKARALGAKWDIGCEITHDPVQIAFISDTHMPKGARRLPETCVERLKQADLIVHAGDLLTLEVLRQLETYGRVIAVHGNVDDRAARAALPAATTFQASGKRIAVTHDAGPATRRLERLRLRFPDADAVIFGHSHLPLHEQAPDGFQIFNPGSPTERRRAPWPSMGIGHAERGRLTFEVIRLG
jgi:putative phosphoesterase